MHIRFCIFHSIIQQITNNFSKSLLIYMSIEILYWYI